MELRQLGCGIADGVTLIVALIRAWVQDILAAPPDDPEDSEGVSGLDFENAYGRFHRFSCMRGARELVPAMSVLAACQWQLKQTAWQRADGGWRLSLASRGAWQGARLMQVLFCLGREYTFSRVPMLQSSSGVYRVGYQDGNYLVGSVK